jgi:hypothetical protein
MTTVEVEQALAQLRQDLHAAARRRIRRRRQLRYALFLPLALVVGVGTAIAITSPWTGHDVTPADIERQSSVVTEPTDCTNVGCNGRVHKEVVIVPAMGASFVLPSGRSTNLVPAGGFGPGPPPTSRKLTSEQARYGWPELTRTGGFWSLRLPDGTRRRITWRRADGSMKITDTAPDGSVTVTPVHAGDVLPLVPDSLDANMRSLEKAVTFDFPDGVRVFIFPTFNETYVGFLPSELRAMGGIAQVMPRGEASRYGLVPKGEWNGALPVTPEGGSWTVSLPGGGERTIGWKAGENEVTLTDVGANGERHTFSVPTGHELPLVPFR